MISTAIAMVLAIIPESSPAITSGLGTMSLLKIMETYFTDLEKDISLSSEALFWLARLRQEGHIFNNSSD